MKTSATTSTEQVSESVTKTKKQRGTQRVTGSDRMSE